MGATAGCCVNRGSEEQAAVLPVLCSGGAPPQSPTSARGEGEDGEQFFDCVEDAAEERIVERPPRLRRLDVWLHRKKLIDPSTPSERLRNRVIEVWLNRRRPVAALPLDLRQSFQDSLRNLPQDASACLECTACMGRFDPEVFTRENILNVIRTVRQAWEERRARGPDAQLARQLGEGFPELEEWTREEVVRRMLRAGCGSEKDAVQILNKAIECRVRERELFQSMRCAVKCDMRVIGRDVEGRPTVYVCARSQQQNPLKDLRPQIFLAFEAAVRLTSSQEDQVVLITDMTGFCARLNMDVFTLRSLSESFGSVFADRLQSVLIVDLSFLANTVWSTCKPMVSERTRKKINFVGERAARKIIQERFEPATCERILSAFELNRQRASTHEERALQAQRTAITDVPLGRPAADKAG